VGTGKAGESGHEGQISLYGGGLREGVDYAGNHDEVNVAAQKLVDGKLDAIIYTSAALKRVLPGREAELRLVPMPSSIAAELSSKFKYYVPVRVPGGRVDEQYTLLAVTAWLVMRGAKRVGRPRDPQLRLALGVVAQPLALGCALVVENTSCATGHSWCGEQTGDT